MSMRRPQAEYLPPEREGIDRYAAQVCAEMAERHADPSFTDSEIRDGLAEFLHLAGKIQAKYFSKQEPFDKSGTGG